MSHGQTDPPPPPEPPGPKELAFGLHIQVKKAQKTILAAVGRLTPLSAPWGLPPFRDLDLDLDQNAKILGQSSDQVKKTGGGGAESLAYALNQEGSLLLVLVTLRPSNHLCAWAKPPSCLLSDGALWPLSPPSTSARLLLRSGGITSRFAVGRASGRDNRSPIYMERLGKRPPRLAEEPCPAPLLSGLSGAEGGGCPPPPQGQGG